MSTRYFLIFLFFTASMTLFSQEEIKLDIDGQDLIEFGFIENTIMLNLSSNAGAYKPKGDDGLIKILDVENQNVLNQQNFSKGANVIAFGNSGAFISNEKNGAIINPLKDKDKILYLNETSTIVEFDIERNIEKELDYYDTRLFEDKIVHIGPLKKKEKSDPKEWLIYQKKYTDDKSEVVRFQPKKLNNKDNRNFYSIVTFDFESIYLINSTYEGDDGKKLNKKKNLILEYDYEGNLKSEIEFEHNIDSEIYSYVGLGFSGTYNTRTMPGSPSVRTLTASSFGKVFIKKDIGALYYLAGLKGEKKNHGTKLYVAKYDLEGNKLWENNIKFSDKTISSKELKYISFHPLLVNEKVFLFEDNNAFLKKFEDIDLFSLDDNNGEIVSSKKYDKLKGVYKRGQTWHNIVSGKIISEKLSSSQILDNKTILTYNFVKTITEFLESEVVKKDVFYYTHYFNNHYYLLRCDYKNMVYNLYKF